MKRQSRTKLKNTYGAVIHNEDTRPLNQREQNTDTRKGMVRQSETVNINFLEKQLTLFKYEN